MAPNVPPAQVPTHVSNGRAGGANDPFQAPPSIAPYSSTDAWTLENDWSSALGNEKPAAAKKLAPDATSAWDSQSNPGFRMPPAPTAGDAMDLIAQDALPSITPKKPEPMWQPDEPQEPDEVETLLQGAKDLIDLDDHSGAMDLILKAAELAPNDSRVKKMREKSETTLQSMFESKLGAMSAVPQVVLKNDEIIWLNLDHRAGFVLAQIDGTVSFEDLFEVSGMSRLDTARILAQLVEEGVIRAG